MNTKKYQLGLLYLIHLLINADGVIDDQERMALLRVKEEEDIPASLYLEFEREIIVLKEREVFQLGVELLNECNFQQKLKAFVHLYRISEADGHVHVKEVKFLLYSIRETNIEFDDVVKRATQRVSEA